MSTPLYIIGAGNVGGFVRYNVADFGNYHLVGFFDDDDSKVGSDIFGIPVLGKIMDIAAYLDGGPLNVVVGVANPRARYDILNRLAKYPLHYPNCISKFSWISQHVSLGVGVIVYPGVTINYGSSIGDFSIINMNCSLGHDVQLSRCVTLAPGVNIGGCSVIEEGADLGIGASTKQNIKVGSFARVGGQAMVIDDVVENTLVVGVPARLKSAP